MVRCRVCGSAFVRQEFDTAQLLAVQNGHAAVSNVLSRWAARQRDLRDAAREGSLHRVMELLRGGLVAPFGEGDVRGFGGGSRMP